MLKRKTIKATGHSWSTPEYTWSKDGSVCIANRACSNDGCNAKETEMGEVTSEVKTIVVKTRKLKKKTVKASLKGSKSRRYRSRSARRRPTRTSERATRRSSQRRTAAEK